MLNIPLQLTLVALLRILSTTPHAVCSAPIGGRTVPADFVGNRVFVRAKACRGTCREPAFEFRWFFRRRLKRPGT
jgi:hypothetical protein